MVRTGPIITLAFSDDEPPFDALSMVTRIVDSVPERFLVGLTEIVLTNASTLPRGRRRGTAMSRGRKVRIKETGGLYHYASDQRGAWIEIFVDSVLRRWGTGWLSRTNWFRETELSEVLFHEIGHHIHHTVRPEYREKEDVADVWRVRLQRNYIRQRYRWVRLLETPEPLTHSVAAGSVRPPQIPSFHDLEIQVSETTVIAPDREGARCGHANTREDPTALTGFPG
jgi:hypothetical protein